MDQCDLTDPCQPSQCITDRADSVTSVGSNKLRNTRYLNQDIELAIRVGPFVGYPKKVWTRQPNEKLYRNRPLKVKKIVEKEPPPKWVPRFCLRRIHELLLTDGLDPKVEGCLETLWALYKTHADGFSYDNIDLVGNIIYILSTNYDNLLKIEKEMFEEIVEKLHLGIYMEAVSKEAIHPRKLSLFLTVLGLAILKGCATAQLSITSILLLWTEKLVENTEGVDTYCQDSPMEAKVKGRRKSVPNALLYDALEKSMICRVLAKCLRDVDLEVEPYLSILSLLTFCTEASPALRDRLWKLSTLDSVLIRLGKPDPLNRILLSTADFLHCLFVKPKKSSGGSEGLFLEKESFEMLFSRFTHFLSPHQLACCKTINANRNETAFLICLVCEFVPVARMYLRDHSKLIASILKNGIMGESDTDFKFSLHPSPENVELLQYVTFWLKCLVEDGGGEPMISDYNIVSVLLMLLLGPCPLSTRELKKGNNLDDAGWAAMHAIAQYNPLALLTQHGVTSLLAFLKLYGDIGEGDQHINHMSVHTLRILLCGSVNDSQIKDEVMGYLIDRDGMATFLNVQKQLIQRENFDAIHEAITSNILLCCSILGRYDLSQKKAFNSLEGVLIVTQVLKRLILNSFEKRHLDTVLRISISECISGCIAYYPASLEEFIVKDGIYVLMDFMELSGNESANSHLISCLLQLCDYPRCLQQLIYWNGTIKPCEQTLVFGDKSRWNAMLYSAGGPKAGDSLQELEPPNSDRNISSLICNLWREEEKRLNVLRDPDGCISSISHPLMSRDSRDNPGNIQVGVLKSRLDLSTPYSIRHKVYVLVQCILEVVKTESKLLTGLSRENQVIMPIILNYSSLKASEIFIEIIDEMQQEGSSVDKTNEVDLTKLLTISKNRVIAIIELQRYFIRRNKEKDASNEHEFYTLLKQCQLQDHLLAASELETLAKTINYQFLTEKRLWQKSELEKISHEFKYTFSTHSRLHRTSDGILNITAWNMRTKHVETEPPPDAPFNIEDYEDNNYGEEAEDEGEGQFDPSKKTALAKAKSTFQPVEEEEPSESLQECTPNPPEKGVYEVSPNMLKEQLEKLEEIRIKQDWIKKAAEEDEENGWKMRLKYKKNWYPLRKE